MVVVAHENDRVVLGDQGVAREVLGLADLLQGRQSLADLLQRHVLTQVRESAQGKDVAEGVQRGLGRQFRTKDGPVAAVLPPGPQLADRCSGESGSHTGRVGHAPLPPFPDVPRSPADRPALLMATLQAPGAPKPLTPLSGQRSNNWAPTARGL